MTKNSVIPPNSGELVWLAGMGVQFKLGGERTGGRFAVVEHPLRPGAWVPPHTHTHEDEYSYVLEGEIGARIGDEVVHVTPGAYILKPRGVPHAFWNAGTDPARILEIISPAGFERYFAEQAATLVGDAPPDMEKVLAIAAKYGLELHLDRLDWIPEHLLEQSSG